MTDCFRSALVAMVLLSQLLGGAVVLCVEGDGSLLVELQLGSCCDGAETGGGVEALSVDSADACGACNDLVLIVPDRDHGAAHFDAVIDSVSSPPALHAPMAPVVELERPDEFATGLDEFAPTTATVAVVAATIVLTC
ncbi:MAG: hypothetical protein DHS20C15_03920 [Planctomycetota bacterium]|nr:MAG: hypothetical protein DHS20C15_03920 [Planctomycetota bacterium]